MRRQVPLPKGAEVRFRGDTYTVHSVLPDGSYDVKRLMPGGKFIEHLILRAPSQVPS